MISSTLSMDNSMKTRKTVETTLLHSAVSVCQIAQHNSNHIPWHSSAGITVWDSGCRVVGNSLAGPTAVKARG